MPREAVRTPLGVDRPRCLWFTRTSDLSGPLFYLFARKGKSKTPPERLQINNPAAILLRKNTETKLIAEDDILLRSARAEPRTRAKLGTGQVDSCAEFTPYNAKHLCGTLNLSTKLWLGYLF